MHKLILIDDSACENELDVFISKYKHSVKSILPLATLLLKQKIVINTNTGTQIVNVNDIMYCELKHKNLFKIHVGNRAALIIPQSFTSFQKHLPDSSFIRIHQSYIININYIESYLKNAVNIILQNGTRLPVSVRKKEFLLKKLNAIQI